MKKMNENQLTIFDSENINDVNKAEPKKDEGSGNPASMLGYFYQIYYALYFLLKDDDFLEKEVNLQIEVLDDINIEIISPKKFRLLIQNKMLNSNSTMSNSSKDFWKTIRNWINLLNSEVISLENTSLLFVITSKVSENSIPELLSQHPDRRDIRRALQEIENTIHKSESTDSVIQEAHKLFKDLEKDKQLKFLEKIEVLYLSPSMTDIEDKIKDKLKGFRLSEPELSKFYKEVEKYWLPRVLEQLKNSLNHIADKITIRELNNNLHKIVSPFFSKKLIIYNDIPESCLQNIDERYQFIKQLKMIGYTVFDSAINDYRKAYYNRDIWHDDGNFDINEYENKLISKWHRKLEQLTNKYSRKNDFDNAPEDDLQDIGDDLYNFVCESSIPLLQNENNNVTDDEIMCGSYHILADQKMTENNPDLPKVYWHPKFRERIKK